jgi:hypothetical protein
MHKQQSKNNVYRLRLRELRNEFADTAKRDARRAKLISNAERAEAEAEMKQQMGYAHPVRHKWL